MPTHSSILAWRIPGTEEPGGLCTVRGAAKSRTQLSTNSSPWCLVVLSLVFLSNIWQSDWNDFFLQVGLFKGKKFFFFTLHF